MYGALDYYVLKMDLQMTCGKKILLMSSGKRIFTTVLRKWEIDYDFTPRALIRPGTCMVIEESGSREGGLRIWAECFVEIWHKS